MKFIKITSSLFILIILSLAFSLTLSFNFRNKSKKLQISSTNNAQPRENNSSHNQSILVIEVLIESLCPSSIAFIKDSFSKFVNTPDSYLLADVLLYPFGNAKETYNETTSRYEFKCQHGSNECFGNLIQVCAISLLKSREEANEFFICSYSHIDEHNKDFNKNLKFCLEKLKYTREFEDKIIECTKSKEGNDAMHYVANRDPDHKHVPWVIVNGFYDQVAEEKVINNLLGYVCEYSGVEASLKNRICSNFVKRVVDSVNNEKKTIESCENPFYKK